MKYVLLDLARKAAVVAPLAGAWIEMLLCNRPGHTRWVAPLAGAWIEIRPPFVVLSFVVVAPLAGAWIEIPRIMDCASDVLSRSPRGSVD